LLSHVMEHSMEKYQVPRVRDDQERADQRLTVLDALRREIGVSRGEKESSLSVEQIVRGHEQERSRRETRRKWEGRGLIVLGALMMLGSCPLYALSAMGPYTIIAGFALIAGGGALLSWRPRLKDTNEAFLVAMKYGNRLTTPRLALEMDVSLDRAEKIIQELMRNGIAEIDLDHQDPDHAIVYKIKGL
jgi:hypothetical protein